VVDVLALDGLDSAAKSATLSDVWPMGGCLVELVAVYDAEAGVEASCARL